MKINLLSLLILFTCSTFISSCNNEDDSIRNQGTKKLIKRIKSTGSYINIDGEIVEEVIDKNFIYDKDYKKLIQVNYADGMTAKYTYDSNENLTSINYSREGFPNHISEITLFYNNKKLSHTLTSSGNNEFIDRNEYLYNKQGKLIKLNFCNSGEKCSGEENINYEYTNNNIISKLTNALFSNHLNFTYKFDNKKNAYINSQEIIRIINNSFDQSLNENNVSEEIQFSNENSEYKQIITYTYDSDNFPTLSIGKDQNGNNYKKIEYEYYQ